MKSKEERVGSYRMGFGSCQLETDDEVFSVTRRDAKEEMLSVKGSVELSSLGLG